MRAEGRAGPVPATAHVGVMDGLRGLAILLVVLYHYWIMSFWEIPLPAGLPIRAGDHSLAFVQFSGALGVELFFFISAFCLFHPHAKAMFGRGPVPTLRHFAYRRTIKIIPSWLLAIAAFWFVLGNIYPSGSTHGRAADLGLHLVFLHNLPQDTLASFVGVGWSLAVEVQFYVLFPLLAWAFRRRPLLTAAAMTALALGFRSWILDRPLDRFAHGVCQLPGFLDVFALGMLTAYLMCWVRERPEAARRLRHVFTAIAVSSVAALLLMFDWSYAVRYEKPHQLAWQYENRLPIALLFLGIALASAYASGWWQRVLANRALVFLSTISYNLYLWHHAVGITIRNRGWWKADTPSPVDDPHWRWTFSLIAIAASILVATLVTYAFERPLLRRGVRGVLQAATSRPRVRRPSAELPQPQTSA